MEDLLSENIEKCLQNQEFNEFPVSMVYRIIEKSKKQLSSDLLYDFIKKSINSRYILFRFLVIRNLSDEKFNDLHETLLANEINLSNIHSFLQCDLPYLKEIKDENAKLKNKIDTFNSSNEQYRIENEQLKTDKTNLINENEQLKTDKINLSAENDKLKKANAVLVIENEHLKKEKTNLIQPEKFNLPKSEKFKNVKTIIGVTKNIPTKCKLCKTVINIAIIGSFNSGKSTIAGNLMYKLGCIDSSQMAQIEREASMLGKSSNKYAFIMDRMRDEREKGMSIEAGKALIETPKYNFVIIDTPGNRKYTKNATTSMTQAKAAILVVDASDIGLKQEIISEEQIKDLSLIAFSVYIRPIIVTVNKMDDKSVNFDYKTFDVIKNKITIILTSIGFKPDQFKFVPISGFRGDNLTEKSTNLRWWTGGTLIEMLETLQTGQTFSDKPLRLPIDDVYSNGVGTVVTGSVQSGVLKVGQEVVFPLSKVKAKVKSIEMFHNKIEEAIPHNIVGINIDAPARKILRGDVCGEVGMNQPIECVSFTVKMIITNHPGKIRAGYQPYFFCNTAHVPCTFEKLIQRIDRRYGKKIIENPDWIQRGDGAVVVIKPLKPIILESFKDYGYLGYFVIRDMSTTVAVGYICTVDKKPLK